MAFQYNDNRNISNHTHIDYPLTCGIDNAGNVTWVDFINFRNVEGFGVEPNKQSIGGTWLNVLDKLQACFDDISARLDSLDTRLTQSEESLSNVLNQVAPVISKANSSYYYTQLLQNTYNVEIFDNIPTFSSYHSSTSEMRFTKNIGGNTQEFKIYSNVPNVFTYKEDLKVVEAYLMDPYSSINLEQFSNYGIKEIIVDVACISTYENDPNVPSTMSVKILGKNATLPIIKPYNNEPIRYATFKVTSVPDEFEENIPIISDLSYTGGDTPFYIKISVVCDPDEDTEPYEGYYWYVGTTKPILSNAVVLSEYPAEQTYTNNSGEKAHIFVLTNSGKTVTFIEPSENSPITQKAVDTTTIPGYNIFETAVGVANGGSIKIRVS